MCTIIIKSNRLELSGTKFRLGFVADRQLSQGGHDDRCARNSHRPWQASEIQRANAFSSVVLPARRPCGCVLLRSNIRLNHGFACIHWVRHQSSDRPRAYSRYNVARQVTPPEPSLDFLEDYGCQPQYSASINALANGCGAQATKQGTSAV